MCNLRSRLFFHWNLLIKRLVNRVFVLVDGIIFNRSNELMINPIQNGPLWSCSQVKGGGGSEKVPPSLKSVTHILQWWNLVVIPYWRRSKKCMNHVTHPLSPADISIFSLEISKDCFNKNYYNFDDVSKIGYFRLS